jgi:hypothetical protein
MTTSAPRHANHETLKAATRREIKTAGGIEAAAEASRVGKSEMSNYQSDNSTRFMPIDVLADLMAANRTTNVLETLASIVDCSIFPNNVAGRNLTGDVAALAEHAASLFHHFARECDSSDISKTTLAQLERDLAQVVASAMHARAIIRERMRTPPAK